MDDANRVASVVAINEGQIVYVGDNVGPATKAARTARSPPAPRPARRPWRCARPLTFEDRKRSVLDAMAYATSVDVTTRLDQGAFQATNIPSDGAAHQDNYSMHLPFLAVYKDGQGTIRLRINFLHQDVDTN